MNSAALLSAYQTLKSGTVWKKWAPANPGEVTKLDAYLQGLADGSNPAVPTLATATGRGLAGLLHAAAGDATKALSTGAATLTGPMVIVTQNDGEQMRVLVDNRQAAQIGPAAAWTLDTTQLANGAHTVQFVYLDAAGQELRRSDVATVQVKN